MRQVSTAVLSSLLMLAPSRPYTGPRQLGPASIDKQITLRRFLSVIREHQRVSLRLCFQRDNTWLQIESDDSSSHYIYAFTLSRMGMCGLHLIRSSGVDFADWQTEKGIHLGSTKQRVHEAYGEPETVEMTTCAKENWLPNFVERCRNAGLLPFEEWMYAGTASDEGRVSILIFQGNRLVLLRMTGGDP